MDDFVFSSNLLYENLRILKQDYPFIQTGSIGKSIMGKDIPFVRIGRGQKEVFYSASYHANEWITSLVLLEFIHDYCEAIQSNSFIWRFSARHLFESVSIYIVPLVNPDGVDLIFIGSYINLYYVVCKMQNEHIFFYFHLFRYNQLIYKLIVLMDYLRIH